MSDHGTVAKVQEALGEMAYELLILQEQLVRLNRRLPVPPNLEAMLEDEVPPDLATEVSGCIECIANDYLRELIEMLERAASVTARELERDFRERQGRHRPRGPTLRGPRRQRLVRV